MSLKVTQNAPNEREAEACPYCGQMTISDGFCNCYGAQRAARIAQSRQSAHEQVRKLFRFGKSYGFEEDVSEHVITLLYSSLDAIADGVIVKSVINITQFSQAIICTDNKGLIKVQRKDVKDVALTEQA